MTELGVLLVAAAWGVIGWMALREILAQIESERRRAEWVSRLVAGGSIWRVL